MSTQKYERKWEELNRAIARVRKFYKNYVQDGLDSFQGPKDYIHNFFRISYELKEALKNSEKQLNVSPQNVEDFSRTNDWVALSIDITNKEKHNELKDSRTGKSIGVITSHIHLFDPKGMNRTELKIEIDGRQEDCLQLAEKVIKEWKIFLTNKDLI